MKEKKEIKGGWWSVKIKKEESISKRKEKGGEEGGLVRACLCVYLCVVMGGGDSKVNGEKKGDGETE